MTPILNIFVFLALLVAACLGEILALRNSDSRELTQRPKAQTSYRFLPPAGSGGADRASDSELLDIVLLASVDGKFHALNRTSGHTLWSMSSFAASPSISSPSTLAPLVRTIHAVHDPDIIDDNAPQEKYIIEPQSGDIYVMTTPTSPLQRFPYSMSELVDLSPFSFPDRDDHRVFVGRKTTSLLLVELETGKIKATLNSECPWDPFEGLNDDDEVDLDELEGTRHRVLPPTEVFIGRTDYHISIHTRQLTRDSGPRPPAQNLSFSAYGPNNQDIVLQTEYRRTKDDTYIQSLPNGDIIAFKAHSRTDGAPNAESPLVWGEKFDSPIVAVFDVLRKPSPTNSHSPHTFVLLQPRPGLQDFLPSLSMNTPTDSLRNLESAYVGLIPETGSLFAMSPSRYPLVAFGNADQRPVGGKYIDAPDSSDSVESADELPTEVDEITRVRKQREKEREREIAIRNSRCEGPNAFDLKCLVGIRRLEGGDGEGAESRLRRLLDGSPASEGPRIELVAESGGYERPEGDNNGSNGKGWETDGTSPSTGLWPGMNGNVWQATVTAILLAAVSYWFGSRRYRSKEQAVQLLELTEPQDARDTIESGAIEVVGPGTVPESFIFTQADQEPLSTKPLPPVPTASNPQADDGEDSGGEGDGDADGDANPTSGKRKGRRGKRGKRKKAGNLALVAGGEDEDEMKTPKASGNVNGSAQTELKELQPFTPSNITTPEIKQAIPGPSLVVSDTVLGFGSHGTVVYQGSLQGRAVAVKRLLQDFVTLASREVSILQESDDHPNVIRYYYQESQANFLYIALELCPASLADIIESPDRFRDIAISFDPKRALKQITGGLKHLHALKLVHRDIKPQNILVSGPKAGLGGNAKPGYRMLISDFGLCKKLDFDQTSFLPTAHGAMATGTVGWRAPEILRGEVKLDDVTDDQSISSSRGSTGTVGSATSGRPTRLTKSVDIFALGCLFYYTLTNGAHPFGDRFEREVNILKNAKNLDTLERFGEEGSEATDLIEKMLDPEARERPDTTAILLHPFFWDPARRLNFLQDASDRFEIMCRDPKDANLLVLELGAINIVGPDWQARLDKVFLENLGKFRKYDGKSVQDLLRALRNKKHHYQDLPDNVKRHLGPMPEGFLAYFTRRYPRLFLHVHSVIGDSVLRSESMFRSYFELGD